MGYDVLTNKNTIKNSPNNSAKSNIYFINLEQNLMKK